MKASACLSAEQIAAVDRLIRRVSAEEVMPRFRNLAADEVMEKAADDLVTIADRRSEERLTEGLAAILPGSGVIGEEACAADPAVIDGIGTGLQWIVDPIDGTGNFAAGRSPFGIMVALAADGETVAGWMFDPVLDRMCRALAGEGADIDGKRVQSRETGQQPPVTGLSMLFLNPEERVEAQRRAEGRLTMVDIPRCAAEQYPRIVLGQNDMAVFNRTLPWDHAPGVLFLTEAGGKALRPDGSPYRLTEQGRTGMLAAATPRLWDQGAAILYVA